MRRGEAGARARGRWRGRARARGGLPLCVRVRGAMEELSSVGEQVFAAECILSKRLRKVGPAADLPPPPRLHTPPQASPPPPPPPPGLL